MVESRLIPCIVFALKRECQPFCRLYRALQTVTDAPCWAALCGQTDVPLLVVVTGVGRVRTERALAWLLSRPTIRGSAYHPSIVLAAGFCGALQPGLRTGDVIMVSEVVDADNHASWPLQVPPDLASWPLPLHQGRMVTVPRLAAAPDDKRALASKWNALAVDMESAEVARLCNSSKDPLACIRVVVDELEDALSPQLTSLLSAGSVSPLRLAATVASAPATVPELWHLAKSTRLAADRLAKALTHALALPLPWKAD